MRTRAARAFLIFNGIGKMVKKKLKKGSIIPVSVTYLVSLAASEISLVGIRFGSVLYYYTRTTVINELPFKSLK